MKKKQTAAALYALLAAALYAVSAPVSKLLLSAITPRMLAALLYLGAGFGLLPLGVYRRLSGKRTEEPRLSGNDLPYIAGMLALDIAAPILLMLGLTMTTAANAALLNNFEIVATSLIALCFFRETISKRLWLAILLVSTASVVLTVEGGGVLSFSRGSLLVLLACVCWGLENNCTRALSSKSPTEIVILKGIGSGAGALVIALAAGERMPALPYALSALLLGFIAYGLSIFFYIRAQRDLGAAKTSVFYAVAPFISAGLSLIIFWEAPSLRFCIAMAIMLAGAYFSATA